MARLGSESAENNFGESVEQELAIGNGKGFQILEAKKGMPRNEVGLFFHNTPNS